MVASILPAGGIEPRLTSARLCENCGYIHPGEAALLDQCEHCGTTFDAENSSFPQALLDQPTVRAARWARISSDEEERAREGYVITTQLRFGSGQTARRADVRAADSTVLIEAQYALQAELWRINHGWRRSRQLNGFAIEEATGRWGSPQDDEIEDDGPPDPTLKKARTGVKPYVTDSRNVLWLRPTVQEDEPEKFVRSLAAALQRGIQFTYQVEEQEVAVELIGRGEHRRLLLWEAAEGGTGVWERIFGDRRSFADIADEALRVCHFDPRTGEPDPAWVERCAAACYDCLLSLRFNPQRRHPAESRRRVL